jgi:hypothetical protein
LSEHKREGFPNGIPLHDSFKNIDPLLLLRDTNEISLPQKMSYDSVDMWMNLVTKYSYCDLTRSEDKLWAFSGIAKLFQGNATGQYFVGLWELHLLEMMDWRVYEQRPPLSSTYRAPSWSWASVDGPVHPIKPGNQYNHLACILEAKTCPIGELLGGISHARLRLRGPLVTAKCQAQSISTPKINVGSELFPGQFFPGNTGIQLTQNDHIVILLFRLQQVLFAEPGSESWELVCIVLQIVHDETRSFRRTGILVFRDESDQHRNIVERGQAAATECEIELL